MHTINMKNIMINGISIYVYIYILLYCLLSVDNEAYVHSLSLESQTACHCSSGGSSGLGNSGRTDFEDSEHFVSLPDVPCSLDN